MAPKATYEVSFGHGIGIKKVFPLKKPTKFGIKGKCRCQRETKEISVSTENVLCGKIHGCRYVSGDAVKKCKCGRTALIKIAELFHANSPNDEIGWSKVLRLQVVGDLSILDNHFVVDNNFVAHSVDGFRSGVFIPRFKGTQELLGQIGFGDTQGGFNLSLRVHKL